MRARTSTLCLLPCIPVSLALSAAHDRTTQRTPDNRRPQRNGHESPASVNLRALGRGNDDDDTDSRIVGGSNASIDMFPHQVAILTQDEYFMCGASLISDRFILSAAHCDEYAVKAALNRQYNKREKSMNPGQQIVDICQVQRHPSYGSQGSAYDISIYMLCEPVTVLDFDDFITLDDMDNLSEGQSLTVTGWGATAEGSRNAETLQEVEVLYIPNSACSNFYGSGAISSDMLCAGWEEGGKDACQGDSGGPLVIPQASADGPNECTQVGVVSWGAGCARREKPGVYAKVSYFKNWITDSVSNLCMQNSLPVPVLKFASQKGNFGNGGSTQDQPEAWSPPGDSPGPSDGSSAPDFVVSFNAGQLTDVSSEPAQPTVEEEIVAQEPEVQVPEVQEVEYQEPYVPEPVEEQHVEAFENASSELYYAPPKSPGCCWYLDYSNVARCSTKPQCNASKETCVKDGACINGNGTGRKYFAPGEEYELGTQSSVLSVTGFSGASESTNTKKEQEDLSGLCCWTSSGCAPQNTGCNDSRQACHDICMSKFSDEFGSKNQSAEPVETVEVVAEAAPPVSQAGEIEAGETLTTVNGVKYDALYDMKIPDQCADHPSAFYGDNSIARSCQWTISRTQEPGKVQKRCSKYGDLCPVSCGLCGQPE